MSTDVCRRASPAGEPRAVPRLAVAAAPFLVAGAALAGCTSNDAIGGCWATGDDDTRTVSFFVDTDDGTVVGSETRGEGDDAVRTDFEGRLDDSGGTEYRIDASCTGGSEPSGCDGVADWSLRCALDESGDEPVLRCSGSPFASQTELTSCQGSATVPQ